MKLRLAWAAASILLSCATPAARIDFDAETPVDVQELARATFADFLAAFPSQEGCIGRVALATDWHQDDRGRYEPDGARITLRIPGTAAKLRDSLLHELAHHLESACPSQLGLREAFLRTQGFGPSAPWFEGDSWAATPSEHFAEAVIEAVEGRRNLRYGIDVTAASLGLVVSWGQGEVIHAPETP